jgi:hypothetical protein
MFGKLSQACGDVVSCDLDPFLSSGNFVMVEYMVSCGVLMERLSR